MMEDTGEDLLRQKPNIVSSLFKRLGQVSFKSLERTRVMKGSIEIVLKEKSGQQQQHKHRVVSYQQVFWPVADLSVMVGQMDTSCHLKVDFYCSPSRRIYAKNRFCTGNWSNLIAFFFLFFYAHPQQSYQKMLDDSTPYVKSRWISFAFTTVVYLARILYLKVCGCVDFPFRFFN